MTIEDIRVALDKACDLDHNVEVDDVMESIVTIRSAAYNEGWNDAVGEHVHTGRLPHYLPYVE